MIRRYTSTEHQFFDQLVVYIGSLCGLSMGISTQKFGPQQPYSANVNIIIQGKSKVSGIEFVFYPHQLMEALVRNSWPDIIEFHERPLVSDLQKMGFKKTGLKGLSASLIQAAFVHYYESLLPNIEGKYGEDKQSWPSVWNFGRIVRNAFVHGGKININNPNADSVNWMTLTYRYDDNGRQIVYQDLTAVEIILLMENMDTAV